jgi:flagellar protein FlbD
MIHLTRLNGNPLVVNSDLIKYAESSPDTVLTLVNGEKIVVLESCEDVVRRTIAYRAQVFAEVSQIAPQWPLPAEAMRARESKGQLSNQADGRRE